MTIQEALEILKKQNALLERYLRDGRIIAAFEMSRSQTQFLDFVSEKVNTESKGGE